MTSKARFAIYMGNPPTVLDGRFNFGWQLIHDSAQANESHVDEAELKRAVSAAGSLSFTMYPGGLAWPKSGEGVYELSMEPAKTYLMCAWLNPYAKWKDAQGTWDADIAWSDTVGEANTASGEIAFVGRVDNVETSMGNDGLLSANVTAVETADEMDEQAGWGIDYASIDSLNVVDGADSGDSSIKVSYSTGKDYGLQLRTGVGALNGWAKYFNIGSSNASIKSYEFKREGEEYPDYVTLKKRLEEFVDKYGLEWEQVYPDYEVEPLSYQPTELAKIQVRPSSYVDTGLSPLSVSLGYNLESYAVTTSNDGIKTVRVPFFGRFNVEVNGEQKSYAPTILDVWTTYASDASKYRCHQGFLDAYKWQKSKHDVVLAWVGSGSLAGLVSPSAVAAYGASLEFYNAGNELGLNESSYTLADWPTAISDALDNKTVGAWSVFWQKAIMAYAAQLEPTTTVDVSGYDVTMEYGGNGSPPHLFQQCKVVDTVTGKTYSQRVEGYTARFEEPWKYDLTLGSIPYRISK